MVLNASCHLAARCTNRVHVGPQERCPRAAAARASRDPHRVTAEIWIRGSRAARSEQGHVGRQQA